MSIFDPSRKPNKTPVARQIVNGKPVVVKHRLPPSPTWNYETPMARLSYGVLTAKEDRSIRSLYDLITRGPLNSGFVFPDTGFVTTQIQEQFWNIANGRRIVFPEIIAAELSGWIVNPLHNKSLHNWLARAISKCNDSPQFQKPFRWGLVLGSVGKALDPKHVGILDKASVSDYGFDYYVNVLSIRKRLGIRVARELSTKLKRLPTENEMRRELQQKSDERVAPLAFKGWKDQGKRNFTADEELVVSAAINAIMSGETTIVLTRDTDVFEQFAKLMEIMTANYMCWRFGLVRHLNPNITMHELENDHGNRFPRLFEGQFIENAILPHSEGENLPPYEHTPVHCFCVLVGNTCYEPKISIAGYCLEREMQDLLFTKSSSAGKNSPFFGDRNVVIGSNFASSQLNTLFVIGEEAQVEYEGISVSQIDVEQSLRSTRSIIEIRW